MDTEYQPRQSRSESDQKGGSCESFQFLRRTPGVEISPEITERESLITEFFLSKGTFLMLKPDFRTPSTIPEQQEPAAQAFLQLTQEILSPSTSVSPESWELEILPSSGNSFLKLTSPRDGVGISERRVAADTTSEPAALSPIGKLPQELQLMVLSKLCLQGVKHSRVTSRSWATAGMELLFQGQFLVRPELGFLPRISALDDLSKLEALCQHPYFSHEIKSLTFAKSGMSRKMFALFVMRHTSDGKWDAALYGIRESTRGPDERYVLEKLFPALPNLSRIDIMPVESYPNKSECSAFIRDRDLDKYTTLRKDLRQCIFAFARRRCTAILLAANQLRSPLQTLSLTYLPVECFWGSEAPSRDYTARAGQALLYDFLKANAATRKTMSTVENLTSYLAFCPEVRTNSSNYDLGFLSRAVGNYLECFQNLRRLDLGMASEESSRHREFVPKLYEVLAKITFPHLVDLRFNYYSLEQSDILPFILNQSATLKNLLIRPGDCQLRDHNQDTKYFFTAIKNRCKSLERFSMAPLQRGRPEAADKLYTITVLPSGSWTWEPVPDHNTGPMKLAKLLEYYVLGRCPWPMVSHPTFDSWPGRSKFLGTHEQFLAMSQEEVNRYFESGWKAVVGENGLGAYWDSEIEDDSDDDDEEEEGRQETARKSDVASLYHLLSMEHIMEYMKTNNVQGWFH